VRWNFGPAHVDEFQQARDNLRALNIPHERLTAQQFNRRFPQFAMGDEDEALFQADGGVVYADNAVRAFWKGIPSVVSEDPVVRLELPKSAGAGGGDFRVITASGRELTCNYLVLTAGPWTNQVLSLAGLAPYPLNVSNEQANYFEPKNPEDLTKFTGKGGMPVFINHWRPPKCPFGFYGIPHVPGGVPGVKAAWHGCGEAGAQVLRDFPKGHRNLNEDKEISELAASFVARYMPKLTLDPTRRSSLRCLYTSTPDRHFALGPHPDYPRLILGCGFSGHGFKFAPVIGEILTAYVTGKDQLSTTTSEQGLGGPLASLLSIMRQPELSSKRFHNGASFALRTGA